MRPNVFSFPFCCLVLITLTRFVPFGQVLHDSDSGPPDIWLHLPTGSGQHHPQLFCSVLLGPERRQCGGAVLHIRSGEHPAWPVSMRETDREWHTHTHTHTHHPPSFPSPLQMDRLHREKWKQLTRMLVHKYMLALTEQVPTLGLILERS